MNVYDYLDYKKFVVDWVEAQPRRGRGLMTRMAEKAQLSSTLLSQIFRGDKHLSLEAAYEISKFMALETDDATHFLELVQFGKAGSVQLRTHLEQRIKTAKKQKNEIARRVGVKEELPELVRSYFYSHWAYTGIRNMTACPNFQDVDSIAKHLGFPRSVVTRIVDFLLKHQLCVEKDGKLDVGPQQTHVSGHSPLVNKHHQNWRLHGLNKMIESDERNLFFTGPMSISEEAADKIKNRLSTLLEEVGKDVRSANSEIVHCLNIDWFRY